jgi:DNA repair protein RadC
MSRGKDRDAGKIGAEEQGALFGTVQPVDDKVGHRQRLRDRFRNGGPEAIPDYELLEMILFRVIPRGDTKPLAKKLLAKFGSFAEVVSAPPERLKEVDDGTVIAPSMS